MEYQPILLLLFLVLFSTVLLNPVHIHAQNNSGTILVGQSLTAAQTTSRRQPWVSSPSGDFAFGFQQLNGTDHQFMLCLWYANVTEESIVWYASGPPAPEGSEVQLDADRGLVLSDPQGRTLWKSDGFSGKVAYGILNDTGNFALLATRNSSTNLWDTFRHPTDTLLPGQVMDIGSQLISRRSEANFSQGRFYLVMRDDGNLVLSTKSLPTNTDFDAEYYNTQTSDPSNQTNTGFKLMFSENGSVSILKRNNVAVELKSVSNSISMENHLRLTLNFDGVLGLYQHPKNPVGNQSWIPLWTQPDNICRAIAGNYGSGACGYNNVCSLDTNNRPYCECPPTYTLVDPSDKHGSCTRDFLQICNKETSGEDLYNIIEIANMNWPFNDVEHINPYSKEECRAACLNDCLCDVAIYGGSGCWKKRLPLSNGVKEISGDTIAFLKVRKGIVPPKDHGTPASLGENKDKGFLANKVLLGTSVSVNILLIAATCSVLVFIIHSRDFKKTASASPLVQSNLCCFLYKELAEATKGFTEEIGRGASAIVYKGETQVGIVAVKKLDRLDQNSAVEFKAEMNVIGQTHHKNLVRLHGYCNEDQHHILVYEYMSNGTLANFLFSDLRPCWSERVKIAIGIAHGLAYLHDECSTQIIHCDIKPQNILLDDHYNARISDFGLAKILMLNESRTNTGIRGTKGYVAPEWFRNNKVTVKVDVYSFGVLLMEIITCRRNVEDVEACGEDKAILVDWLTDCFNDNRLDLLVEDDAEALDDMEKIKRFIMTAIWCIQEDPSLRPTMRMVTQMLEEIVQVHVPPYPYPLTGTN
ncbi:unnamed protein product [Cuscuta campestris]|uniref:Receptor-like serine/threonine-protein kinase n=1 Tax=Cuscuta campestris TaxID=132261 RepID=A0A484M1S4_9ASTE|nr:unnamed protein product [Cuscuta campestris]